MRGEGATWALVLQLMRLEESPAQLDLINLTIFAVGRKTRNVQLYAAADGTAGLPNATAQLTRKYISVIALFSSIYIDTKSGR